ncbi:hypothetical protein A3A03_02410 [Candidatus Nomurabacteria bacterium RIFCSPLOWO2_01_FULL_40_18]|uniref:Plasmid stabilization protein n=1 Tax=Candidatus Nomurabacteria bacterium RIFCSPLOWO2_01_FULL_40_18 TaxID=1801773 RepID=A0A1F6XK57_9BACT|nr:MAG: hypothetical protein A3A03_02410 [Candidatus Nomurabacteria bacterium RIFCSPLOWO2_01_FULL_40_18]
MKIAYTAYFLKLLNKLELDLKNEVVEKIELFKDKNNHKNLNVHKLHGKFAGSYSFYINYKIRVVFEYINKEEVAMLLVGSHDIYK